MEQTCLQHKAIERNTAMIPDIVLRLDEIHSSLVGTMITPGWLGRVASLESQMRMFVRLAWIVGIGILTATGTAVWAVAIK